MSWRLCGNGVQVCNSMFSTKHVLMVLPRRQCGQYCRIQCCSLAFSGDVLPTEWMSEYWILCVCVFTLLDCKKKFCTCWGQARHNPRNLINWLCHKLLPFVFNNYHRSDNVIPYGLKNAVRELKEFLVSVWVTIFTKKTVTILGLLSVLSCNDSGWFWGIWSTHLMIWKRVQYLFQIPEEWEGIQQLQKQQLLTLGCKTLKESSPLLFSQSHLVQK